MTDFTHTNLTIPTAPTPKDPDETLDYSIDYSDFLAADDSIATSAWTTDAGITAGSSTYTNTATTVYISGGTVGTKYLVTNEITTANNLIVNRSFYLKIKEL